MITEQEENETAESTEDLDQPVLHLPPPRRFILEASGGSDRPRALSVLEQAAGMGEDSFLSSLAGVVAERAGILGASANRWQVTRRPDLDDIPLEDAVEAVERECTPAFLEDWLRAGIRNFGRFRVTAAVDAIRPPAKQTDNSVLQSAENATTLPEA